MSELIKGGEGKGTTITNQEYTVKPFYYRQLWAWKKMSVVKSNDGL